MTPPTNLARRSFCLASILISAVFFVLNCSPLYSQTRIIASTIELTNGEAYSGKIRYDFQRKNPDKILFKKETDSTFHEYSASEIKRFEVNENQYFGAIIEHETSETNLDRLDYNPNLNITKDTVFVKALFIGQKSLFLYTDYMLKENYYIKVDNNYELLKYKKYLRLLKAPDHNGVFSKRVVSENTIFKGQLINYLSDCNGIQSKIDSCHYLSQDLVKIFIDYHQQIDAPNNYNFPKVERNIAFGALAGINRSTYHLNFPSDPALNEVKIEPSISLNLGIFAEIYLDRGIRNNAIRLEIVRGEYLFREYKGPYYLNVNAEGLYFNCLYKRTIQLKRSNFYLYSGADIGYNKRESTLFHAHVMLTNEGNLINKNINKIDAGLIAGAGLAMDPFFIESRYTLNSGIMAGVPDIKDCLTLQLGIRFY